MDKSAREPLIARSIVGRGVQVDRVHGAQVGLPAVRHERLAIGDILAHLGKLSEKDIANVLNLQKKEGQLFGQTAVKHNLVVEADVQRALSIQFGYPVVHPNTDYFRQDLRAAYDPFSEHVHAISSLRSELLHRWLTADNKIVAIVSPRRGEGRSYLSANLAVVFAHIGCRTLLVDADLRFPSQHDIFKRPNGAGLSSLLTGRSFPENILKAVPVFSSLRLLVSGPAVPNPVDLLASPAFSTTLRKLKERFNVILIDTPCNLYPEVVNIASNADRILMVMRKHRTSLNASKELTTRDGISNKLVGCVLSCF